MDRLQAVPFVASDGPVVQALSRLRCNFRLLLTGTPLQNNLHELWALLNFLLPECASPIPASPRNASLPWPTEDPTKPPTQSAAARAAPAQSRALPTGRTNRIGERTAML